MARQITSGAFAALIVAAGCNVTGVDDASSSLGGGGSDAGPAEQCLAGATQPILFVLDGTTHVGTMTMGFDSGDVIVTLTMDAGYGIVSQDVMIGVQLPLTHYPNAFDPPAAQSTTRIRLTDLGAICTDLLKLRVDLVVVSDAGVQSPAAVFGDREWPAIDNPTWPRDSWYDYYGVCMPCETGHCRYTQGYWKTHPEAWPVDSLVLGGVSYSKSQLLSLLWTAPRGDASLILAHQLIAAMLNYENGADLSPWVDDANQWLMDNDDADGRLPFGVRRGAAHTSGTELGDELAFYNQTNHCD